MTLPSRFIWSDIMSSASDGSMRAHVDVDAGLVMAMPAEAPLSIWNPQECPTEWLPVCAYNYSVFYKEDIWPEQTLRNWIDGNWKFIRSIGTLLAFQTALSPSGYTVVEAIRPPQGIYASPALSKAELDAWYELMPEIRITYANRKGQDNGQTYANATYAGDLDTSFAAIDSGAALYGRYAVLRQDGIDTPLLTLTETKTAEQRTAADHEQFSVPGLSTLGIFANDAAADDGLFVNAAEVPSQLLTLRVDTSYVFEASGLSLNTLVPGLQPIDIRSRTISDIGDAGLGEYASDGFANDAFVMPDNAALMLADVIYLLDETIAGPMTEGFSFANVSRVGIALRTMELMIDLHTKDAGSGNFANETFVIDTYAVPQDTSHRERAMRAVNAARGLLDTVNVRFDVSRPLSAEDFITKSTSASDWVKNNL